MATTPKTQKKFLELIREAKLLPLAEALAAFANNKGKLNVDAVSQTMNFLWNGDTFDILDANGIEDTTSDDTIYASPDGYTLRFKGFVEREKIYSRRYADYLNETDVDQLADRYAWVGTKRPEPLRIFGDTEGAMVLAERVRAFTHLFALSLVAGRHERLASLFYERPLAGGNLDDLLTRIANLEKTYGTFDHFDHVAVVSVYGINSSGVKEGSPMKLAKGTSGEQRRGESTFELISVHTPNGLPIHAYTISLSIIEEDSEFRVCNAVANSEY